tara:strand:- start:38 stop:658 length:621 start_codon:yes stop_codon:yes gene_type:complete
MKPTTKLMKRLSLYLFLVLFAFPAPSQADDIRDFQIEGMSIGDSLLKHFTKKEIETNLSEVQYPNRKYTIVWLRNLSFNFEIYDALTIAYETYDKKYYVHSIVGSIYYKNNFERCYKKMEEIEEELSDMFNNAKHIPTVTTKHNYDKTGNSKMTATMFILASGDEAQITCFDWSKELFKKESRLDELGVSLSTKEFGKWVFAEAYK